MDGSLRSVLSFAFGELLGGGGGSLFEISSKCPPPLEISRKIPVPMYISRELPPNI